MTQDAYTTKDGTRLSAVLQTDDLQPCRGCYWADPSAELRPGIRCLRPLAERDAAPCVASTREDGRDMIWIPAIGQHLLAGEPFQLHQSVAGAGAIASEVCRLLFQSPGGSAPTASRD